MGTHKYTYTDSGCCTSVPQLNTGSQEGFGGGIRASAFASRGGGGIAGGTFGGTDTFLPAHELQSRTAELHFQVDALGQEMR